MKKLLIFLTILLSSYLSKAQMNYAFAPQAGSYSLLAGGANATLVAAYPGTKSNLDESFANNVPLGFTFQFNGINYTQIHLNVNGFASLGSAFISSTTLDPSYNVNDLRSGNGYKGALRPILAPFWDDLQLTTANDITYKIDNAAPNRVFTAQWANVAWQGGSAAISFQIKLYESTNVVEFIYNNEAAEGGTNKSASIGITTENNNQNIELDSLNFMSLSASTAMATASSITETETINTKPANGQIYRFTPNACMPPSGILLNSCGTNEANLSWTALQGATSYVYALSNIDVQPFAGTTTSAVTANFKNLSSNTYYYFYIKTACGSVWNRYKFKTSVIANLPYTQSFENTLENRIPDDMTSQTYSNGFADIFWQTSNLLTAASGTKAAINASPFTPSKTWLYTPTFNLIAGAEYELSYKNSTTGATHILDVKYGKMTGEAAMLNSIFAGNAIVNTAYETKSFKFTPTVSGEYNIGFNYKAEVNNDLFLLDDIELKATGVLPVLFAFFKAKLQNNQEVKLNWQTKNEVNASHFMIQRSVDGINFETIGRINCKGTGTGDTDYDYYDRNPLPDISYYRLKQFDKDGKSFDTNVETIKLKTLFATSLYPNPSSKEVFVKIENTADVSVRVFNISGQEINVKLNILSKNEIKITPNQALSSGIYLVNISSKTGTIVLKWMVL